VDLGDLLSLVLGGLVVGGLARLAVPGPDPMPVWLTVVIGLVGVFVGGAVGFAVAAELGAFLGALLCATLVVVAYRRFVQRRGITGPEAQRYPTRGLGIRRAAGGPVSTASEDVQDLLAKLTELHDAGVITSAEFEAKRRELLARR
jgi:uncharacterized membrane protein YeaQ/YmgE (transglycosylase-associated protein family)